MSLLGWSDPVWLASSKGRGCLSAHRQRGWLSPCQRGGLRWNSLAGNLPWSCTCNFQDFMTKILLFRWQNSLMELGQGKYLNLNPSLGEDREETQSRSWCINHEGKKCLLAYQQTHFLIAFLYSQRVLGGSSSLWVAPFPVQANLIR